MRLIQVKLLVRLKLAAVLSKTSCSFRVYQLRHAELKNVSLLFKLKMSCEDFFGRYCAYSQIYQVYKISFLYL